MINKYPAKVLYYYYHVRYMVIITSNKLTPAKELDKL